ncbi:helix-turn-helix domain-containing protein [Starkeya sp. 3C]|uniref:Helix-turn-helix domain-containing protein n=1 Tax=Ancylobacter moscoviensis TaxID=2597768 RepID=A0ABY3DN35_9HYPH|nr:helix-turn-helix domain-containing protein [Ancylobacter moscoviensis]
MTPFSRPLRSRPNRTAHFRSASLMIPMPPEDSCRREDDAPLEPLELAADALPGAVPFDAFRAAFSGVVELHLVRGRDGAFPIQQTLWDLGRLALVSGHLPGPGYAFGWRHARKSTLEHWYVLLRDDPAAPDTIRLSFHCLAEPFQTELETRRLLALFMPRDLFPSLHEISGMLDHRLESGAARLLADFLLGLDRQLPRLRPSDLAGVLGATRGLVEACVASCRNDPAAERGATDVRLLERARRLIEQKIDDADLSPASLAEELFVSRSRLYRSFEPLGGVAAYIRRQRLLRTRDALLDTSDTRSIVRIAEQCGFPDASTFSRAFKHEFGVSPRAVRKMGWTGSGPQEDDGTPPADAGASRLETLLRRLRT